MLRLLQNLDRRWIFLMMFVAVTVPILAGWTFPENLTENTRAAFAEMEKIQPGDRVLISYDFDPSSAGELSPMATALTYHAAKRGARIYYMSLWPVGPQLVEDSIHDVLKADFPQMRYGHDYVNLGYKSGYEGVIKVIVTDFRKLYSTDARGEALSSIPMMDGVVSLQDMKLIASVSAGYAGAKEWVQYAKTAYPDKFSMMVGCTGVQAPPLLPYVPAQLPGLIAAIKGASEYEKLMAEKYGTGDDPKYNEGRRRMGSQLVAHVLMVLLIIVGNIVYFAGRRHGAGR
ncbi:MAG: hypothetical protein U0575_00350 [Phycisphaerales bacterium]